MAAIDPSVARLKLARAAWPVCHQAARVLAVVPRLQAAQARLEDGSGEPWDLEGVFLELAWESHSFLDATAHFTRAFNVDTLEKPKPVPRQLLDEAAALRDIWEHSDDYPMLRRPTEVRNRAAKALLHKYEVEGHHNTALAFAISTSFDPPAVVLGQRVDVGELAAYARQLLNSPA